MSDPHAAIRRALADEFDSPRSLALVTFIGGRHDGLEVNYESPTPILLWEGEPYELFDHRNTDEGELLLYRPVRGELD